MIEFDRSDLRRNIESLLAGVAGECGCDHEAFIDADSIRIIKEVLSRVIKDGVVFKRKHILELETCSNDQDQQSYDGENGPTHRAIFGFTVRQSHLDWSPKGVKLKHTFLTLAAS